MQVGKIIKIIVKNILKNEQLHHMKKVKYLPIFLSKQFH